MREVVWVGVREVVTVETLVGEGDEAIAKYASRCENAFTTQSEVLGSLGISTRDTPRFNASLHFFQGAVCACTARGPDS